MTAENTDPAERTQPERSARELLQTIWGSAGTAAILLAIALGSFCTLGSGALQICLNGSRLGIIGALGIGITWLLTRSRFRIPSLFHIEGFLLFLILLICSDLAFRPHALVFSYTLVSDTLVAFILGLGLVYLRIPVAPLLLVISMTLCFSLFFEASGGRILFSDDHSSFFYRLTQLKEHFPHIPFYNPLWNAGVEAREFFPSGILSVFLLFAPIIYLFPLEESYSFIVALLLFGVTPLSLYAASRTLRLNRTAACFTATLSLAPSLFWFRWALAYGTLGFITSAVLLPLILALGFSIARNPEKSGRMQLVVFAAVLTLGALWSPALLAMLPLFCYWAYRLPVIIRVRRVVITMILTGLVNALWLGIFLQASQVHSFIQRDDRAARGAHEAITGEDIEESDPPDSTEKARTSAGFALRTGSGGYSPGLMIALLREQVETLNPLLLLMALPGIALLPRNQRLTVTATALWLLSLGVLIAPLKPRLELDRMLVILGVLLTVPAGQALCRCLELIRHRRSLLGTALGGAGLAAALLTPVFAAAVLQGKSSERFWFASPAVTDLSIALRNSTGSGRGLFAGFTLHELSHGHVAPLPYLSGKPLIASRYQHDRWEYTDVIPDSFRARGVQGVEEYLELHNVSVIVTHDTFWRKWFASKPKRFERITKIGRFSLFRRLHSTRSYFMEGSGEVLEQRGNSIILRMDSSEAIIKFNYLPFLVSTSCTLSPAPVAPEINFIRISDCQTSDHIVIESKSPLRRFFGIGFRE